MKLQQQEHNKGTLLHSQGSPPLFTPRVTAPFYASRFVTVPLVQTLFLAGDICIVRLNGVLCDLGGSNLKNATRARGLFLNFFFLHQRGLWIAPSLIHLLEIIPFKSFWIEP